MTGAQSQSRTNYWRICTFYAHITAERPRSLNGHHLWMVLRENRLQQQPSLAKLSALPPLSLPHILTPSSSSLPSLEGGEMVAFDGLGAFKDAEKSFIENLPHVL